MVETLTIEMKSVKNKIFQVLIILLPDADVEINKGKYYAFFIVTIFALAAPSFKPKSSKHQQTKIKQPVTSNEKSKSKAGGRFHFQPKYQLTLVCYCLSVFILIGD